MSSRTDLPDSFSPYKEVCQCGHDKASHFEKKHTCLGMHCDCKEYLLAGTTKPAQPRTLAKGETYTYSYTYSPTGSDHDDDDGGPLTPRQIGWPWGP